MHLKQTKVNVILRTIFLLSTFILFNLTVSYGVNRFSVVSGNWNSNSTWSATSTGAPGASVPVAGDVVTIENGNVVTVNADAECANIQLGSPSKRGGAGTLTFNSGVTLTVSGAVVLGNTGSTSRFGTIIMTSGGTLSCASLTSNSTKDVFTEGIGTIVITSTNTFPIANTSGILNTFNNIIVSAGTTTLFTNTTITGNLSVSIGATLNTNNKNLTLNGDFTNSGTFTGGSSNITLTGTTATQSISGFTTTGNLSMTKTSGTATLYGNVNGGALILNGAGTLNLGAGLNHRFTGTWTRTNGTLNGGSSILNFSLTGTVVSGTGGTFTPSTGTVNYSGAAQSIAAYTYNNLTLSGTGAKTFPTGTTTVNGVLSIENGAIANVFTGSLSYGSNATLQYNTTSARTASAEWVTPFIASGGIVNAGSGIITINGSVTLTSGLSLTGGDIAIGANTLTLNGNFSGSTNYALVGGSTSNLIIGNSGSIGTIYFDQTSSGTTNRLQNFTINRNGQSVTLGNTIEVTGTVTLSNGTLASAGFLTLVSNASGTARIGTITGTGAITGNVTIQRFIPGGHYYDRAYRFLASPASGQTIAAAWQQDIHITGAGTGGTVCPSLSANSNGFDRNIGNTASIYTYSEITGTWTPITTTTLDTLKSTTAYRVFVRGNRSQACGLLETSGTPAVYATPIDVTLKAKGTITTGTVSTTLTNTVGKGAGWNFVTNPYPSAIDWNNSAWISARGININATIYIWNPTIGSAGSYASYNTAGGSTNGGSNIIQSGQSFWVRTTGNATITFQEAYKSTDQNSQILGKTSLSNNLKIQLKDSAVLDEAIVFNYPGATNNIENVDGQKMGFTTGSIATYTSQNDTALTYNALDQFYPSNTDTVFIKSGLVASKSYVLNFIGAKSFSNNIHPYLFDRYTSTLTDLTTITGYSFTTNTIAGSISQTRFYILFNDPNSLPVVLNNFSAQKKDKSVLLKWNTSSEINSAAFVIERSNDAINFQEINTLKAAGNSSQNINYSSIDLQPNLSEENYYRLKQIDIDGKFTYSSTVVIDFKNHDNIPSVNVWPNPVNDKINIGYSVQPNELIACEIYDFTGKKISTFSFVSTSSNVTSKDVSFLNSGIYFIKIKTELSESIVKFVK